jgi:hypothetical protein
MKNILKHTVFLVIFAGIFWSCNDKEPNYPIDISFSEILVTPTTHWNNSDWENKIIFINNLVEMEQFIANTSEHNIDFSKQTLVLAKSVVTPHNVNFKNLQEFRQKYVFTVDVVSHLGWNDELRTHKLFTALIVDKLSPKDSEIDLMYSSIGSFYWRSDIYACPEFADIALGDYESPRFWVVPDKWPEEYQASDIRTGLWRIVRYRPTNEYWECYEDYEIPPRWTRYPKISVVSIEKL